MDLSDRPAILGLIYSKFSPEVEICCLRQKEGETFGALGCRALIEGGRARSRWKWVCLEGEPDSLPSPGLRSCSSPAPFPVYGREVRDFMRGAVDAQMVSEETNWDAN